MLRVCAPIVSRGRVRAKGGRRPLLQGRPRRHGEDVGTDDAAPRHRREQQQHEFKQQQQSQQQFNRIRLHVG